MLCFTPLLVPALVPAQTLVQLFHESHGNWVCFQMCTHRNKQTYFCWVIFYHKSSAGIDTRAKTAQGKEKEDGQGAGAGEAALSISSQLLLCQGLKKDFTWPPEIPILGFGVVCFNAVKWCFYSNHLFNKLFNLVGSDGVLIIYSPKFRSLNLNSSRTPFPSMSLFQLGECLRYLNNLSFSYMYEKMHSLGTIMQLCLSSEMAKRVSGAILRNRNRKAKALTQAEHKKHKTR